MNEHRVMRVTHKRVLVDSIPEKKSLKEYEFAAENKKGTRKTFKSIVMHPMDNGQCWLVVDDSAGVEPGDKVKAFKKEENNEASN